MSRTGRIAAGLLLLIFVPFGLANQTPQDDKVDLKTLDSLLFNTLRDVINRGADMYNNGDHTSCYRLFEGALLTARPLLAHRPELQKTITNALGAASRDPVTYRRAFALRAALDKTRKELNPNPRKDEKIPLPKVDDPKDDKVPLPKVDDKKDMKKDDKKPDPDVKKDDKKDVKKPDPDPDLKKDDKKEDKKPDDKKPNDKKDDDEKKDDDKKPDDKKPDDKKDDKEKLKEPKKEPDDN